MRSKRLFAPVLMIALSLVSCRRDPASAKKHYLESGNRYFDKARYREASIQYSNAIKIDKRFGPAYYKLALTYMKMKPTPVLPAVKNFRVAIELLNPKDNAAYESEYLDSIVQLSELYLFYGSKEKTILEEVQGYVEEKKETDPQRSRSLFAKRPFDARRLQGDLDFVHAIQALQVSNKDEGMRLLGEAMVEYHRADAIQPGNDGVILQMARALEIQEEYAEAEQMFRRVIDHDKTKGVAYGELYRLYAFEQKLSDAEQVLKLGFHNNPKEFSYLEMLAIHYGQQGRRDDMVAVLEQIKSHAKEWDQAYMKVGDFYMRSGDLDSAAREYRDGMVKDPKNKVSYQKHVIEVLMRQNKRAEAAEVNAQILKADPNDNDARGLQATLALDRGDVAKALTDLQAVVTRAPENPVARYHLGRAHAARGEVAQARQMFQKAIELRADYSQARLALAQLAMGQREYDAALQAAGEILKYDANNGAAHLVQAAALAGQKKFAESRALLNAMVQANPRSPEVYFQIGVVSLQEGKYKDAEDSFRRAYELNPANSRSLLGMVRTQLEQGKPEVGLQMLRDESRKAPNRMDLLLDLGNTALETGRYDEALANYQKVLDSLDKDSKARGDIYMRIGETFRRRGDDNSAAANLQKARDVLPDNELIMATLALVLDHGGRRTEAQQVYQAAIKINPNNAVAMNNLAYLMAESNGDLNQALTYAQRAKQIMPDVPEVSDTLGWIYLKMGNADSASGIFQDLVKKVPKNAVYHLHLARAFTNRGDKVKALDELREAQKYSPSKIEEQQIKDLLEQVRK